MSMLFKRIKDWATSITAFRTGDYIAVDGPSGTAKMSKDDLLQVTAENSANQLIDNESSNYDFAIVDHDNNAVAVFKNGHILTKNFDSSNALDNSIFEQGADDYDLIVADENENALAIFKDGDFKTKNFKSNKLESKKICFIGDSITQGVGASDPSLCYVAQVSAIANCTCVNLGLAGDSIGGSGGSEYGHFKDRATSANLDGADLVVVFGGTNDFGKGTYPIGDLFKETTAPVSGYRGTKTFSAPDDKRPFGGAMHELIATIRTNAPLVPIMFITPINRGFWNDQQPKSNQDNVHGDTIQDFRKAIADICNFYSIPVLHLDELPQLDFNNPTISARFSADNLHPNDNGHKLIARAVVNFINKNVFIGE